jgi:DNA adenine methylase
MTSLKDQLIAPFAHESKMTQLSSEILEMSGPQPFVKWAGGKSQLVDRLFALAPSQFKNYIEPFVGGGAFFFHLRPEKALISDANFELVNSYRVIKTDLSSLLIELRLISKVPLTRTLFRSFRDVDPNSLNSVRRAARFIFLNKTCFNGLYRVNKQGKFNVPFGKYPRMPTLYSEGNLKQVNRLLRSTEIMCSTFQVALERAAPGDFVYLDPPYAVDPAAPTFTGFVTGGFTESDQRNLAAKFKELDKRGCCLMLSNSETKLTRELYEGYRRIPVTVNRMINCVGEKRTGFKELVILNYGPPSSDLDRWSAD